MKKSKRFIAAVAAAILAISSVPSMMMTAFADASVTIKYSDGVSHTIEAYQVFSGTYAGDILTDVQWGSGVKGNELLTALKADALLKQYFGACSSAEDVAKVLSDNKTTTFVSDSANMKAFADIVAANLTATTSGTVAGDKVSGLASGYYLLQDSINPQNGAKTNYILNLVGDTDIEIKAKASKPDFMKKVVEDDKTVTGTATLGTYTSGVQYNDVADYCIGETVPFELVGSLPSTYEGYKGYYYKFTDTLADSLELDENSVKVYYKNGSTETQLQTGQYVLNTTPAAADSWTFTVEIDNVKDIADIDKDSYIIVRYDATLTNKAVIGLDGQENVAYLTYTNNPNVNTGFSNDENITDTPEDMVIVFTYELDVTKYANAISSGNELAGAGFKLKNSDNKWATVDSNNKITGWVDDEKDADEIKSGDDGKVKFVGLDDGSYTLKESTTPDMFNPISDITFEINADTANDQNFAGTAANALTAIKLDDNDASGNVTNGTVSMDVINNGGSTIPSTGGIGTTIFYVTGGALVVGAGVLLIAKRRANKEDKD